MLTNMVATLNGKGGVGKTTTAAHLAGIAAAKGWRTLALDLDGQGNLHRSLGFEYDDGVHLRDALLGTVELAPRPDRRENLFYVGGGNQIEKAVAALQSEASQGDPAILYRIQRMVAPVADQFDLIVVDSPPREMFLRRMILTASRFVVIPVDKDEGTFDGIASVMRSVGEAREYGNPSLEVLAALRFKMVSQKMAEETKAEVEAMIGEGLVLDSWIRNALRAAADLREDSLLAHEYDQAAQQAVPWWKRRAMAPEEKKSVKQYSSAAAGLADDWLGAVSEILTRFAQRSQASEGVA